MLSFIKQIPVITERRYRNDSIWWTGSLRFYAQIKLHNFFSVWSASAEENFSLRLDRELAQDRRDGNNDFDRIGS